MARTFWIICGTLISLVIGYILFRRRERGKQPQTRAPFAVPDEVFPYIYESLGDPSLKTIRVIELLPYDWNQPQTGIQIRLRTISLATSKPEKYEAVSYCWGDANDVRSIYCNGCKLFITASLRNALLRLSKLPSDDDPIRVLWADAICINQNDLDEKSWQVKMMSDIFRNAQRVTIYLGEQNYHSELLEDFIPQLASWKRKIDKGVESGDLTVDTRLTAEQRKRYNISSYGWSNFKQFLALSLFTSRPWFDRVWTIQELVLARDAIVICGHWTTPWSDFRDAIEFVGKDYVVTGADVISAGPNRVLSLSINTDTREASLFRLLFLHGNTLASNPLDHIFALLSLASDRDAFEIDYKKDVLQLYIEAGRYFLESETDLMPLHFARLSRHIDPRFPSWVPDWRAHWDTFPIMTHHDQQLVFHERFAPEWDHAKLKLRGIMIDNIARVGCESPANRFTNTKLTTDVVAETFAVYYDWMRTFRASYAEVYPVTGESRCSAFWKTISGPEASADINPEDFKLLTIPLTIAKMIQLLPFPKFTYSVTRPGILQGIKFLLFAIPVTILFQLRSLWDPRVQVYGVIGNDVGQRMMETVSGYLCLGPQEMQVGDCVFLLSGAQSYVVLREVDESDTYVLVGDCYVHGLEQSKVDKPEDYRPVWII